MFPSPIRLPLRTAPNFFGQAQRRRYAGFLFWSLPRNAQNHTAPLLFPEQGVRVSVVIPKKMARGAQRIQIKRQWRERITALFKQSPTLFEGSYDVVVVPLHKRVNDEQELRRAFSDLSLPRPRTTNK